MKTKIQNSLFLLIACSLLPTLACAQFKEDRVFSSSGDQFEVQTRVYRPRSSAKRLNRTVVIFPPTGGITQAERSYGNAIARRGATAIVLKSWTGMDEFSLELEIHQRLHQRAMKALEIVSSQIPASHKLSVMGTSLGGIFTATAAGLFERPDRYFVIAAGAPVPNVIAFSDQSGLADAREQRMREFNFASTEEYANSIADVFYIDPLSTRPPLSKARLGMVILTEDTTVPTRFQRELQAHWSGADVIELDRGHFGGIVATWWNHFDHVVDFLVGKD